MNYSAVDVGWKSRKKLYYDNILLLKDDEEDTEKFAPMDLLLFATLDPLFYSVFDF